MARKNLIPVSLLVIFLNFLVMELTINISQLEFNQPFSISKLASNQKVQTPIVGWISIVDASLPPHNHEEPKIPDPRIFINQQIVGTSSLPTTSMYRFGNSGTS